MASSAAETGDYDDYDDAELPLPIGDINLEERAKTLGIKYFLVSYAPLNTDTRVSVIPTRAIRQMQQHGCGVPAAMYYKATGADPEMYLLPDPKTLIQLPWKREYGWVASNIYMHGRPYSQCPRRALIKQCAKAKAMGLVMKSGIEPEFMLLNKDGTAFGDAKDNRQPMCLHEPLAVMRTSPVMMRICDIMEELGWDPYEIDHEATDCQYEINFGYTDALTMADRHCFLKFLVKEIAELEGYTLTFMPRPLPNLLCANGLHVNVSLWNAADDTNAFKDPADKELGISKVAYNFIGGLMNYARVSCAVLCPTVNSYKRLNAGSWCPNTTSWGGNNRTVLFRVPANNRVENRLADGAANPYLTQAIILAAGLDGIENKTDPGERIDILVEDHPGPLEKMPENLLDAIREFGASPFMKKAFGNELVEGFVELKKREWDAYMAHFTQWEADYYINC